MYEQEHLTTNALAPIIIIRPTDPQFIKLTLLEHPPKHIYTAGWWQTNFGAIAQVKPLRFERGLDRLLRQKVLSRAQTKHDPWWAIEICDRANDQSQLQVPDLTKNLPVAHIPNLMSSRESPDPRLVPDHLKYKLDMLCPAAQAFLSLPIHTLGALSKRTRTDAIAAYAWHAATWMTELHQAGRIAGAGPDGADSEATNHASGWPQAHSDFVWWCIFEAEKVPLTLKEVFDGYF